VGDGEPEGAALEVAGAVGDVLGDPGVGEGVEAGQLVGVAVGGGDEWEGGGGGLGEAGVEEGDEAVAVLDFAGDPGGFEAGGMGEGAGREGGVGELEEGMEGGVGQKRE